ncbi:MAG: TonB-dependent receptor, partial [Acidobacteriota bacterium]|nr:TonB-dependent receptor [Acidobacteriota bacterium]
MRKVSILAISMAFCFCALTPAQTITGTITGTVTDASGAVAPNVTVTATNTNTNLTNETKTNPAGVYTLPFLPIGSYTVSAEAAGFKKAVIGPFSLETNQTARVDVSMAVGQVSERVEVTGAAPILQTETAQTGAIITAKDAADLPVNGRNFTQLTLLAPGAVTPNPGSFTGPRQFGGGRPYVNGNREQSNNFLLDGVDINEPIDNLVGYNPNVDALQEMQVLTGNGSAEFGNGNGAIVNMSTKSGSNAFHGNAFEFFQNDRLNANSYFNNRNGAAKQAYHQNIYGGTFGGPIKRDRLFFFVDYQGTKARNSGPSSATVVPQSLRNGDLSLYSTQKIVDPLTGLAFPNNVIPPGRIVNPAAKALFADPSLYPLPNHAGTGPQGYSGNYLSSSAGYTNNDQADARVDYRIRDNDSIFGRFSIDRYYSGSSRLALPTTLTQPTIAPTTAGVINWTHTLSPTTINEARIGFTRVGVLQNTTDIGGKFGAAGNQKLGIPGSQPITGISSITFGDFSIGSSATDSKEFDNDYHFSDDFTKQVGRHSIKTGFTFLRYQENRFYAGNNGLLGNYGYDGTYTGNGYADFLLDLLHTKGRGSQTGFWGHRQWRDGIFVQDDFHVKSNLTVNLGLRWEYTQPVYEVNDLQANFNLQTGQELFAGKNGNSRALYKPYWKQFEPRLGFAWTPGKFNNKLVVRGGYGITSYMEGTGANLRLPLNPPFFFESAVTFDARTPGSIKTGFTDVLPLSTPSGQIRAWNPDLRPAFIQQYNLTTEYQFTHSFSLTVGYVGQKGTHLVDPREFNQPLPGVGDPTTWAPLQTRRPLFGVAPLITNISGTDSSSTMNYNGLQTSVRKRFGAGLNFVASYTFSKTMTDNLGYYGSGGSTASEGAYFQNAYNRHGDYGRAFFDATHVFSFGGNYEIPVGRNRTFGKNMNRAVDLAIGGWKLNSIVSIHSGFPMTINGRDSSNQIVRGSLRANRYNG